MKEWADAAEESLVGLLVVGMNQLPNCRVIEFIPHDGRPTLGVELRGARYPEYGDLEYDPGEWVRSEKAWAWRGSSWEEDPHVSQVYTDHKAEDAIDQEIRAAESIALEALQKSSIHVDELRFWSHKDGLVCSADLQVLPLWHVSPIKIPGRVVETLTKILINVPYMCHPHSTHDVKILSRALWLLSEIEELSLGCRNNFYRADERIRAKDRFRDGTRGGCVRSNANFFLDMLKDVLATMLLPKLKSFRVQDFDFGYARNESQKELISEIRPFLEKHDETLRAVNLCLAVNLEGGHDFYPLLSYLLKVTTLQYISLDILDLCPRVGWGTMFEWSIDMGMEDKAARLEEELRRYLACDFS